MSNKYICWKVWGGKTLDSEKKHVLVISDDSYKALQEVRRKYPDACATQAIQNIPLASLRIGEKYRATCVDGNYVRLVSIDEIFGDEAKVTIEYRNRLYSAASIQFYV